MKRVYVATSWRNEHQPEVIRALRAEGFDVYDFRHPAEGDNGFSWREIDGDWLTWTPEQYLKALTHPASERGFKFDMDALRACDLCVMVMPCGMSASLETGYAVGAGKPTAVYVPGLREPDLMVKMAGFVTSDIHELRAWLRRQATERIEDAVLSRGPDDERATVGRLREDVSSSLNSSSPLPSPVRAEQHESCHDLVCNGNRAYPRGVTGHGCSCSARAIRESELLAAVRAEPPAPQRPETGPMQFGDDWPGLFIRGDNAGGFSLALNVAIDATKDPLTLVMLRSLRSLLVSCDVRQSPTTQRAQLVADFAVARSDGTQHEPTTRDKSLSSNDLPPADHEDENT